jgi:hypothetical protein
MMFFFSCKVDFSQAILTSFKLVGYIFKWFFNIQPILIHKY